MRTFWLHLPNILINLFDLQYSNLICHNISASSLLSLVNIHVYPRYFIKSVYEIGKWLICKDGNANLYNLYIDISNCITLVPIFKGT